MQMSRWWVRSGVDSVGLLFVARPEALVVVLSWCVSGSGDEDYGDSDADGADGGADGGGGRWWKRLCYGNKDDLSVVTVLVTMMMVMMLVRAF